MSICLVKGKELYSLLVIVNGAKSSFSINTTHTFSVVLKDSPLIIPTIGSSCEYPGSIKTK